MTTMGIIFGIISFASIVALMVYYYWHRKSCGLKGKESVYVGVWWLAIFLIGFALHLVYYVGKLTNQSLGSDYIIAIATSAFSAIRLFAFDFRQDEIISDVWNYGVAGQFFAIALVVVYVCAGLWTYFILIATFFRGVVNSVKIFFHKNGLPFKSKSTHYIVIGNGANADTFIDNLYSSRKKKNWFYRCFCGDDITVITGEVPNGNGKDVFYKYLNKGYVVFKGRGDLNSLQIAGVNNKRRKTVVVAISDSDEENIAVADIITKMVAQRIMNVCEPNATDLNSFLKRTVSKAYKSRNVEERVALGNKVDTIKLEARIMYTAIDRAEHFDFAENAFGKVNFFNPYELKAQKFFWEHPITSCIPADYIDTQRARLVGEMTAEGTIINPRTSSGYKIKNIFVGFGNANYQMLKHSVISGQLLGVDYNAVVYANDIGDGRPSLRQAMFKQQAPGLFERDEKMQDKTYFESPKEKYNIIFKHSDVLSNEFYDDILNELIGNDYTAMYLALGDDKTCIETAFELRQLIAECFDKLRNVSIYIKVRKRTVMIDETFLNNFRSIPLKIECYGMDEDILTVDNVIAPFLDRLASTVSNQNHNIPWGFASEFERDSNRSKVMDLRTMVGLLGLDIVNRDKDTVPCDEEYKARYGLKDNTVIDIVAADTSKDKKARLKYPVTENGKPDGKILDTARNNLARREHLRWNTFHLANGWTKKPKELVGKRNGEDDLKEYFGSNLSFDNLGRKNGLTKQHACITTFEQLIELRKLQALRASEPDKEENYDTVYHDFTLMDKLLERLTRVPELAISKFNKQTLQDGQ
ncbi:MAG: hypothetical protein J1F33_06030 [Clostridiales bacterium]|nr:hypothetical protein [Clostridiales bacterium]